MLKLAALALLIVVAAAAPLLHTDNEKVIPGSYIVVLNEDSSVLDRDAHIIELEDYIRETNADESDVSHRYNIGSFIGFAARMNKMVLQHQLNHSAVK